MHAFREIFGIPYVALRKESVDRNLPMYHLKSGIVGRSPQGERG